MKLPIFLLLAFSASAKDHIVKVTAWSSETWIAWRSVSFGYGRAACIHQSGGKYPCANLINGNSREGWSSLDYKGSVTFRVRSDAPISQIRLVPCCGDRPDGEYPKVLIEVRIDGRTVHLEKHQYSLELEPGAFIEIRPKDLK